MKRTAARGMAVLSRLFGFESRNLALEQEGQEDAMVVTIVRSDSGTMCCHDPSTLYVRNGLSLSLVREETRNDELGSSTTTSHFGLSP